MLNPQHPADFATAPPVAVGPPRNERRVHHARTGSWVADRRATGRRKAASRCSTSVAIGIGRPVEVKHLRWGNVDLIDGVIEVTRSELESSHRVIPVNAVARKAPAAMRSHAEILGFTQPGHYVWCARQWGRLDPSRPVKKWDTAWRNLRAKAGLPKLRFHDLHHTIITELAEAGVPDHVMESISGHLSRRMLEHYSHVRIEAKREALDALDARRASKFEEISTKLGVH